MSPQEVSLEETITIVKDEVVIAPIRGLGSSNQITPEPNAIGWKIEEEGDTTN